MRSYLLSTLIFSIRQNDVPEMAYLNNDVNLINPPSILKPALFILCFQKPLSLLFHVSVSVFFSLRFFFAFIIILRLSLQLIFA